MLNLSFHLYKMGNSNPCRELLGSNEFEPSLFFFNLENAKLLPASGLFHVLFPVPVTLSPQMLTYWFVPGISANLTFLRAAASDYLANPITLNCITLFYFLCT